MEPAQTPTTSSPARPILTPAIRTFLEAPRYATLATIGPDGTPHQAVVWYGVDGDDLLLNSRRERHWPKNLLDRPRLSLAVMDADRPNHWVGVKGRAELVRDGDAAMADIQALARRYDGADANVNRFAGQDRVTYRVVIASSSEYGA
jgi:PPOX class probable F420-dependent enzyme